MATFNIRIYLNIVYVSNLHAVCSQLLIIVYKSRGPKVREAWRIVRNMRRNNKEATDARYDEIEKIELWKNIKGR